MSGIRRHGRGAGTGHPPLNGHDRRGHRPARAYAGPAARRTRKPSDPGAGRRGTAVAENDRLIQNMKTPPTSCGPTDHKRFQTERPDE